MLGTAGEVIRLTMQATIGWAEFDPAWYRRTYSDARLAVSPDDPEAVLQFYLGTGQQMGHSPNPYFDEAWYLCHYPEVAAAVREGKFASGFDEYCRVGHDGGRSPHWLYDDYVYRTSGEELLAEAVRANGFANRYDHYLRRGSREGRIAHRLFDPACYRAQFDAAEAANSDQLGQFRHFLGRTDARPVRTSVYFNAEWYVARYPAVGAEIGTKWRSALHHYLTNPTPTQFDPLPEFSETAYLDRYADIAAAVEAGGLRNGYQHFLTDGVFELRSPNDTIDLRHYVSAYPSVAADLEAGRARDAFAHYLVVGRASGLAPAPTHEGEVGERQAKALFRTRAQNLLPLFARCPLDFAYAGTPDLAVIMVLHDNFALTLQALGSLRQGFSGAIELILVDSGSSDETRFITRYVRGARVLRFDANIGFVLGCNAAIGGVAAASVLLLNNDVELGFGAVSIGLRRLLSDARIGAVGGKIIRTNGKLQEAGSIVWRDGVTLGYMRDASPLSPEANFVREVDFCSAVFLLLRTDVLRQMDGFAEEFAPAYYEDVDLCVRIAQAGYRVVYDPSVVVHHYEYGSAPNLRTVTAQSDRARRLFVSKHRNYLRSRYMADPGAETFARATSAEQKRILFIEDQVPLCILGSGFVRSNDILRAMVSLGFHVTVFPMLAGDLDPTSIFADMPDTVEVMWDKSLADLPAFLESRDGYFDTIWVARTHNLDRTREFLGRYLRNKARPPRIILDTEAISASRERVRAQLNGSAFDFRSAIRSEFHSVSHCHQIVAVSEREADQLRELGFVDVSVIGHVCNVRMTQRQFARRSGILFVGAIHEMASPNYDGLCWFIDEVLPLIERELGPETRLTVAGYAAEHVKLNRFQDNQRVTLRGAVYDLEPLYDSHRVFAAPTRFAAGIPYKVHEAASFGLPVVLTELLREQIGWESGREVLAADASDPESFAAQIVTLYRNEELWNDVRENAAKRVLEENGTAQYVEKVRSALNQA